MKKTLIAVAITTASCAAVAADEPVYGWSGNAAVGAIITAGNSDTQNIHADVKVRNENEQWRHNFFALALKAESTNLTTADRFALGYKADYKLTSYSYIWGEFRYDEDKFSGFDNQLTGSTGYGRKVLDTTNDTLDVEIGVGQRLTEFTDGTEENETVGRGALFYQHKFNEGVIFTQDIIAISGTSNTSIDSKSAIKAKLAGNFSLEASYIAKHNTDAPTGKEKTDSTTAIALVYGF